MFSTEQDFHMVAVNSIVCLSITLCHISHLIILKYTKVFVLLFTISMLFCRNLSEIRCEPQLFVDDSCIECKLLISTKRIHLDVLDANLFQSSSLNPVHSLCKRMMSIKSQINLTFACYRYKHALDNYAIINNQS